MRASLQHLVPSLYCLFVCLLVLFILIRLLLGEDKQEKARLAMPSLSLSAYPMNITRVCDDHRVRDVES